MPAFEKIGNDRQLQDHWLRRLVAGIIDSVITSAIAWVIGVLILLPTIITEGLFFLGRMEFQFFGGVLFFLYASFFETYYGATLGKQIMNLKVTTTEGNIASLNRTVIRNVSKIHSLLWLIDTLIGMATVGDPHQKYSDRFAGTTVVSTIQRGLILPTPSATPTSPSST